MTIKGYIKVARPPLTILGGIAPLALLKWSGELSYPKGLLIFLTVFLTNVAWTLWNEYFDYKKGIDPINKPDKPLPSGEVSKGRVYLLACDLIMVSLLANTGLAVFFGWVYLLGFLGHATSFVYNVVRKDLFGNICMATTYGLAAFISLYPNHLLFCVPFALFTLAHNLNNQYQDFKAEQTAGVITVPQQLGSQGTYWLSQILLTVTFILFFRIYLATAYKPLLIFLAVAVTTMVSSVSMLMEREKAHKIIENVARRLGRLLLLIGFLTMLL